jgi:hypothetical protein
VIGFTLRPSSPQEIIAFDQKWIGPGWAPEPIKLVPAGNFTLIFCVFILQPSRYTNFSSFSFLNWWPRSGGIFVTRVSHNLVPAMPISITVKIKTYDIISGAGEKVVSALHA